MGTAFGWGPLPLWLGRVAQAALPSPIGRGGGAQGFFENLMSPDPRF